MEDFEKIKEKPYCLDKVWERTEILMMKHKISQTDMVKLCQKKGYSVQQPEISKLKSKRCKITLYQAMALLMFWGFLWIIWSMVEQTKIR